LSISSRARHDFPFLSAGESRRLKLRLEKIREKYGLDAANPLGNQCRWLYSRERREKAREGRIEERDKDFFETYGTQFSDRWTGVPIHATRAVPPRDPRSTAWQRHVRIVRLLPRSSAVLGKFLSKFDPWAALLVDPATIDEIGIEETGNYLIESFNAIAEARFPGGSKESKLFEDFIALLDPIKQWAIEECSVLWPGRGDWVERVVVPAARGGLKRAAAIWRVRASGAAEKGASPDSSTGPAMDSPAAAGDPFDSRQKREAVIERARAEYGTAKLVAKACGVHYTDLRRWARFRGLAKNKSQKQERIEKALLRFSRS
jgi:hypothetical protein